MSEEVWIVSYNCSGSGRRWFVCVCLIAVSLCVCLVLCVARCLCVVFAVESVGGALSQLVSQLLSQ